MKHKLPIKKKLNNGFEHAEEAIKQRGEVFTPTKLVAEMLDKLPEEVFTDKTKTFLDNSCGNGQFLFAVMKRKMWWLMTKGGRPSFKAHKQALSTIYGVELDPKNAEECRQRLLKGSTSEELRAIVDRNIITADGLNPNHPGWATVGYYWDETQMPDPKKYVAPKPEPTKEKESSKEKTQPSASGRPKKVVVKNLVKVSQVREEEIKENIPSLPKAKDLDDFRNSLCEDLTW